MLRPPARVPAAQFQGGGNIPILMSVLKQLIARSYVVRIMVGPGVAVLGASEPGRDHRSAALAR